MSVTDPVEREIKLALSDPEGFVARITTAGFAVLNERVFEANVVYDTSEGGMRAKGELLRLREAGGKCTLTWKGVPSTDGGHKQRTEIETIIGDAAAFDNILRRLGYAPVFQYEKYRTEYSRPQQHGIVTVDQVPFGWFAELEGRADWIDSTASELGFDPSQYITSSYLSLHHQHCARTGQEHGWMVFATQ